MKNNSPLFIVSAVVILAVIIYGGYRVIHHYTKQQAPIQTTTMKIQSQPTSMTSSAMQNSVYKTMMKGKTGNVLTDLKGMTLYTYSKDTSGISTCSGICIKNWPAYTAPSNKETLPANLTIIKRTDGTFQYAWKGMPLYYYIKDKVSADALGDNIGGIWFVVKP